VSIFTVPDCGGGGGGPPGPPGASTYFWRFTVDDGVPNGGGRYLRLGEGVFSSQAGAMLTGDGELNGISFVADAADGSRDYDLEILSDPAGAPVVLATLPISGVQRNRVRGLAVSIVGLTEVGARLVRTSGSGPSSFNRVVVTVEVSIS